MSSLFVSILALVFATNDSPWEEQLKPLHFRIEVSTDKVHSIMGRLEPSKNIGKGYDRVVLDRDGDDEPEETLDLEGGRFPIPREGFNACFKFDMGGWIFNLELYSSIAQATDAPVSLMWSLLKEEQFIFFVNGKARLFSTAEEAKKGQAIRLGPPFRFHVKSATRGPDALIQVGVKDTNDATLRVAVHQNGEEGVETESRIRLTLISQGEARSSLEAEYG